VSIKEQQDKVLLYASDCDVWEGYESPRVVCDGARGRVDLLAETLLLVDARRNVSPVDDARSVSVWRPGVSVRDFVVPTHAVKRH